MEDELAGNGGLGEVEEVNLRAVELPKLPPSSHSSLSFLSSVLRLLCQPGSFLIL